MNAKPLIALACAAALAACASGPQTTPALESARAAVQSAEADPNVSKYAALDIVNAKKELQTAEDAALHGNIKDVDQPAYLAMQTARLAQMRAAGKADDARVAAGQTERDQILLQARTREADNAKIAAENAKMTAAAAMGEAAVANAQAADLAAQLQDLQAKQTPRGLVLTLGDVLFDTGRAQLKSGADRKIDQLAQFLQANPTRNVEIDGFTDSIGSEAYNEDLSQRRADAVKAALMSRNIEAARITTQGFGKQYPVASNDDAAGRQMNRRVEVVVGSGNGPIAPRSSQNMPVQ
jgi:outer membrane protein OmpA-like peptidoglycan-associated protein